MNKIISFFLMFWVFCGSLFAQKDTCLMNFPRHEIGISVGVFSQPSIFYIGSEVIPCFYEGFKVEKNDYCQYNIGTFSLSYRYHFTERHSLGIVSTLLFSKINDKYNLDDHSGFFTFWTLEPQYRFTYKRFKYCALYLGGAIGVTIRFASNDKMPYWDTAGGGWFSGTYGMFAIVPSSHITFFGISLGKNNAANFELGFGTQGILNVGYSGRF